MTGTMPRLTRALAMVGVLTLMATACAPADEEPAPGGTAATPTGGTFSTFITEPEHLSPGNTSESEGLAVLEALFTTLVEIEPRTGEPVNAMAESIETDDNKTFTIKIRDGWSFHNGEEVTARSFVDAWNYVAFGPNAQQNSSFFSQIEGFEAVHPSPPEGQTEPPSPAADRLSGLEVVDELTFRVTLSEPFAQFPMTLNYIAFAPVPEAFFDDPKAFEESPVGNGPFMMDGEWEHNQRIRTQAFPDYAGEDEPAATGIEFRIYEDVSTAYNDLLAGDLDVVRSLPPERIAEAKQEFGDRYAVSPNASYNAIGFPEYLP
ncbi:MAG: ABC transporter substrate-binding protein, partial [Actinomycetota bacterium]